MTACIGAAPEQSSAESAPTGCDLDAAFEQPTRIEPLRSQYYEIFPRLSADELTIYFTRDDVGRFAERSDRV
jgi:hypothetical protein